MLGSSTLYSTFFHVLFMAVLLAPDLIYDPNISVIILNNKTENTCPSRHIQLKQSKSVQSHLLIFARLHTNMRWRNAPMPNLSFLGQKESQLQVDDSIQLQSYSSPLRLLSNTSLQLRDNGMCFISNNDEENASTIPSHVRLQRRSHHEMHPIFHAAHNFIKSLLHALSNSPPKAMSIRDSAKTVVKFIQGSADMLKNKLARNFNRLRSQLPRYLFFQSTFISSTQLNENSTSSRFSVSK